MVEDIRKMGYSFKSNCDQCVISVNGQVVNDTGKKSNENTNSRPPSWEWRNIKTGVI